MELESKGLGLFERLGYLPEFVLRRLGRLVVHLDLLWLELPLAQMGLAVEVGCHLDLALEVDLRIPLELRLLAELLVLVLGLALGLQLEPELLVRQAQSLESA